MSALYIGRFQPFHNGHLDAIMQVLSENDEVIIAIGSASENYSPINPFTAGERIEMIRKALQEADIPAEKYCIIPIDNINNYALWPKHIEIFAPHFDSVYTGSPIVSELFTKYSQKKVKKLTFNKDVSATEVREKILAKKPLNGVISQSVEKFLIEINAYERLSFSNSYQKK